MSDKLIPRHILKDQEFKTTYKENLEKVKAFARLFGINPDMEVLSPKCPFYQGKLLKKEDIFKILRENNIIHGGFLGWLKGQIIMKSRFIVSYYSWYNFVKLINPDGEIRYCLKWDSNYP